MGVDVVDTHVYLHGEGVLCHMPQVRLHWGVRGIDETHSADPALVRAWAASVSAADWQALRFSFYGWMGIVGVSSAAWAERDAFAGALRVALGGPA